MKKKDRKASALSLFKSTNLYVVVSGSSWEKETKKQGESPCKDTQGLDTKEREEFVRELKRQKARKARKRKQWSIQAEDIQTRGNIEEMTPLVIRCNASIRHLATFENLISYAEENHLEKGLCLLKKRMKANEVAEEWKSIRQWLSRNTRHISIAVSIGRNSKGWYSLRCVAVGEGASKSLVKLWLYLQDRREWRSSALSVADDSIRLLEYYKSTCLDDYVLELFEVYRVSLMLPNTNRTYKNKKTIEVLESRLIGVSDGASYVVNASDIIYNSPSRCALCECSIKGNKITRAYWLENDFLIENDKF